MKKIGMIIASAAVAAMVGGSAWAHGADLRHNHDSNFRKGHVPRGVSRHTVMDQYMRAFDRMDRNHDNRLGPREIRRAYGHGPGHYDGRRGDRRDHRSYNGRRGGQRLISERMIYRFDVNNNGFLTRKELRRGIKRKFNRSDRNGNGYLGPRELRDAHWYRGWRPMPRRHNR